MKAILLQSAPDDLLPVTAYFESISEGLAQRFHRCVTKTLETILAFLEASATVRKGFRIRQIIRFRNYGVLFRIRDDLISRYFLPAARSAILAVATSLTPNANGWAQPRRHHATHHS